MGRPQTMRNLVGILKDKVSILKATLILSSKSTTIFNVAVLRATTHRHPSDLPPVEAVLSLAHHHRPSSGVLVHALLRRVHGTQNVYVALKCLITLHHVITQGSPALKDQIYSYSSGPLFNLGGFMDDSDGDTCGLSDWVRWYADVLDHSLVLGRRINRGDRLSCLVGQVERICGAPETLHYQRISLIYETMKLVGEDYRMIMREISVLINQFGMKRIEDLRDELIDELLSNLKRLENCREKVLLMFLNKKKNDGVWELIEEVRKDVEEVKQKRESMRLVRFQGSDSTRTRVVDTRVNESKAVAVVPTRRGKRWLDVDWNPLVASHA